MTLRLGGNHRCFRRSSFLFDVFVSLRIPGAPATISTLFLLFLSQMSFGQDAAAKRVRSCELFCIYVVSSCGRLFPECRFRSTQVQEEAESVGNISGILYPTIGVLSWLVRVIVARINALTVARRDYSGAIPLLRSSSQTQWNDPCPKLKPSFNTVCNRTKPSFSA